MGRVYRMARLGVRIVRPLANQVSPVRVFRMRIPRPSDSETDLLRKILSGARHCESRCLACKRRGPCYRGCEGDVLCRSERALLAVPRVSGAELLKRLRNGRRLYPSKCGRCGAQAQCHVYCPGDGPQAALDLAEGRYLITDWPLRNAVEGRAWLEEAARRGFEARIYETDYLESFLERFPPDHY